MIYRCNWHDAELTEAELVDHAGCVHAGHVETTLTIPEAAAAGIIEPTVVSLFDESAAQANKREAMETVDLNADSEWKDLADAAIVTVARRGAEFTTDDVWELLDASGVDRPHEPRAMGPRMTAAANAGIATPTDRYGTSTQRQGHGRPVRIYRPGPRTQPSAPV